MTRIAANILEAINRNKVTAAVSFALFLAMFILFSPIILFEAILISAGR